jgi:type VI secretion system protein ImpK
MTPTFSKHVDPIFDYVLGLLDRIEQGDEPDPQQTHTYIHTVLLNRAEQQLGESPNWRLARQALVFWIDEMLCEAPWQGRDWWVNNILEYLLLQSNERAILFFLRAKDAVGTATLDALEVYYLCVIMGFRGVYRDPAENAITISAHELPETIEEWLRRTSEGIRLSPVTQLSQTGRAPLGAPPLGGFAFLTSALILLVLAAALFLGVCTYRFIKQSDKSISLNPHAPAYCEGLVR